MATGAFWKGWTVRARTAARKAIDRSTRSRRSDRRKIAAGLAIGASVAAWALAGRWLLYPLLGAGRLSEPHEHRGTPHRIRRPDGAELHVEIFGQTGAPTLVLTNGWRQDNHAWFYLVRDLASRFRVIGWDLRGVGKSTPPANGDYSLETMAGDLEAVLGLAEGPAVLVGHSLGGMIVQTFCRLFPQRLNDRVAGLALVSTTYTNPMKTARGGRFWRALERPLLVPLLRATLALPTAAKAANWLAYANGSMHVAKRLLGFAGRQTWRQVDFSARLSARSRPTADAGMALAALHFDEWETLPRISVPTLVLVGERDRLTTFETNRRLQQRVPGVQWAPIADAGHYVILERPEAVGDAIGRFAETCHSGLARPRGVEEGHAANLEAAATSGVPDRE